MYNELFPSLLLYETKGGVCPSGGSALFCVLFLQRLLSFGSYHLGLFPDRWNVPLHACSYGERTKISFLRYVLEAVDVLLFDEPTNHLDLPSREALARALLSYDGTVVFATHDESFVRDVATDVYRIERRSIRLTDDPFGDE